MSRQKSSKRRMKRHMIKNLGFESFSGKVKRQNRERVIKESKKEE